VRLFFSYLRVKTKEKGISKYFEIQKVIGLSRIFPQTNQRSITSNQVCSHQTSPSVIKDGNVIHLRLKLQLQELAKNREFRRMVISAPFPAFKLKQKLIFNYHKIQVQIAKNEQLG
jgi:hypothetical protein